MPTENIFRGDADDDAQVWKVTPATVEIGDVFGLRIPNTTRQVTYTAQAATVADVVAGLVAAFNASEIPEFTEITAEAASDSSYLTLTADTAGVPFIVEAFTSNTTAGAVTVAETTPGRAQVNEVQRLKLQDGVSGGTFTYANDFGSGTETTAAIAWNATADAVKAAIVALATPTEADLSVVKAADGDWYITWKGAFAASEVAEGTINGASLTGVGEVTVEEIARGRGLSDEIQLIDIVTSSTTWIFRLRFGGQSTANLTQATTAAALQTALEGLSTIGTGNVEVYGGLKATGAGQAFFVKFTGDLAATNLALLESVSEAAQNCSPSISAEVEGGQSIANEFQVVNLGEPTAGTWTLSDGTDTTAALSYLATTAAVEAALEAFTAFDDVKVSGGSGVFGLEFRGSSEDTDVSLLTLDPGGLTMDGTPSIDEVRRGQASVNQVSHLRILASGGTFTLSDGIDTTSSISFGASAATIKTRLEADISAITTVTVTGTGTPTDPYVVTVTSPAGTPITFTGNGASLTGGDGVVTEETSHDAGADEVQTITIDGGVTGGTWKVGFRGAETGDLAYNIGTAALDTALEGLVTIGTGNVAVSGTGPYVITFGGDLAKENVDMLTVDGTNLDGGSGTQALAIVETTRSQGKHHWNDPDNWSLGRVPEYNETPIFESGENGCLYGIDQVRTFTADSTTENLTITNHSFVDEQKVRVETDGGTLPTGLSAGTDYYVKYVDKDTIQLSTTRGGSAVNITANGSGTNYVGVGVEGFEHLGRCTSEIGLPYRNEDGEYVEYRPRFLLLWMDSSSTNKAVRIGEGDGSSSSRLNLDFLEDEIHSTIFNTGGSIEETVPACQIRNKNASSTHLLIEGELGIAFERGDDEQFNTLTQRGGFLVTGPGAVTGDIIKTGGSRLMMGTSVNGNLTEAL